MKKGYPKGMYGTNDSSTSNKSKKYTVATGTENPRMTGKAPKNKTRRTNKGIF